MNYTPIPSHQTSRLASTLVLLATSLLVACDNSEPSGSSEARAGAAGQPSGGAHATFIGSAGKSDVGQGSGAVANSALNSSGTNAGGSAAARGGAGGNGASGPTAGNTSTFDCKDVQCFRAIECVATCDGPVLQSGCCACPSGTVDSIQCISHGGASSISHPSSAAGTQATGAIAGANTKGGNDAVAGANTKGGAGGSGGANTTGASAKGGNNAAAGANAKGGAGGSGGVVSAAGAGSTVECRTASDCHVLGDCCGCYSLSSDQASVCPMQCPSTPSCGNFTPSPASVCVAKHCVLDRSCNDSRVVCKRATPVCNAGQMPSLTPDGSCWDGNCIDVVDCSEVTSCDVCKANGLMCVYENGIRGVAHCVPEPYACMAMSNCSCFSSLCGTVAPCTDIPTGISCGGG